MTSSLVSCEWLNERLDNLGDIVILDVSWASDKKDVGYDKEYKEKHIPGAHYLNVLDADHNEIFIRNLPTPEKFTDMVQNVGVNKNSHVVLYSNSHLAGYFMAGRGWWTFKVYGFEKKGDFVATKDKHVYKIFENVVDNLEKGEFQVVDTRSDELYNEGHIPGAKHLFTANLIDQSSSNLKSDEELKAEFAKAGVDLTKPVTVHCKGGMSSTSVAFVAQRLGQKDIAVFHGGWNEWCKKQQAQDKK